MTAPVRPSSPAIALAMVLLIAPAIAHAGQSRAAVDADDRPAAATTFAGDSGLWFVPAAEVLPAGAFSFAVTGTSETRDLGRTDVSYVGVSAVRGFADQAEVFGSWQASTRIDDQRARGDLLTGGKVALLSERQGAPFALSARAIVKWPTGSDATGGGHVDALAELVASRGLGRTELSGSTGLVRRSQGDDENRPSGVRSGVGLAVRVRPAWRVFAELHGETALDQGRETRLVSAFDTPTTAAIGATWAVNRSMSAGAALTRVVDANAAPHGVGVAVRVAYRPGRRRTTGPLVNAATTSGLGSAPPAPPVSQAAGAGSGSFPASAQASLAFDDVLFDLDRDTLRPSSLSTLDRAVAALQADPSLRLSLEGHTCELGTREYNVALGERRASAVRRYLVSRGIDTSRLTVTSFGEDRPKFSTVSEETRALNRRTEIRVVALR